ncbi:hypothetical protein ACJOV8_016035 [Formosa sp. 3Alg 14/1]|uniref:hypothetical protein n=1 Tax=Formosa sp. 3Alg 14/1 TaxID=3382190 RepID=UPI0039BE429C
MTREYLSKNPKELFWSFWLLIPYLIWMYSIGIELNKKIPKYRELNKIILIGLIAYPIIYIPIGITLLISGSADMNTIMPYHYGAMLCMFLLMILTSITIIRFEKAEKLKQSNGIGLFFGIWYFIFGVWYIQPKLNEYIKRIK